MTPRVSGEKPSVIWSNFIFHLFVFGELPHRSKYIYIYICTCMYTYPWVSQVMLPIINGFTVNQFHIFIYIYIINI
jgi:hypothetical protein